MPIPSTTLLPSTHRATYTLLALFIALPMLNACENKGPADLANIPLEQAAPEAQQDAAEPLPQVATPQSEPAAPAQAASPDAVISQEPPAAGTASDSTPEAVKGGG